VLFIKASQKDDCDSIAGATTVKDHIGTNVFVSNQCDINEFYASASTEARAMSNNDPELYQMGHFNINKLAGEKVHGDYMIKSSVPIWAIHAGDFNADHKAGVGAAVIALVAAIIFAVISCVLSCVAGCCLKPHRQSLIGQPAAVVGTPVDKPADIEQPAISEKPPSVMVRGGSE